MLFRSTVMPDRIDVAPGDRLLVAVIFDHDAGWHIHTNDPQVPAELGGPEFTIKTEIKVEPGDALAPYPEAIQWPEVHVIKVGFFGAPLDYGVFGGRATAYLPVLVDEEARPGRAGTLQIKTTYQACDDKVCLQPVFDHAFDVKVNIVEPGGTGGVRVSWELRRARERRSRRCSPIRQACGRGS